MQLIFSIIIPVYNRPDEIDELLDSLTKQSYTKTFEVIIVEDGSSKKSDKIVEKYAKQLSIHYIFKQNSGAGESRNVGMSQAAGNYFIIFDSDCIIPENYLTEVENALALNYTDAYGGADAAHPSFTNLQKAINFSMTSFFTTGGIRGSKKSITKFQPRSFNFGISKNAFEKTGGFNNLKIGEDIDLTFRLWQENFETQFIKMAFVYHKRRTSLRQFFKQTFAFGKGRPFLNKKFPSTSKITYWFPSIFVLFFLVAIFLSFFGILVGIKVLSIYLSLLFITSLLQNKNVEVAIVSVITTLVQFFGYGLGFLKGIFYN